MLHVCFQSWICVIPPITLQVKFFLRQIWIYRKILFVCVCGRLAFGIWRSALLTAPGHKVSTRLSICLLVRLISACWVTQAIKIYLIVSSSALFAPRKILFVLQKKKCQQKAISGATIFFFHFSKFLKYHQTSKMPSRRFRGLQFFARRHNHLFLDSCPSSGHLISWTWPIDLFSLFVLFPNTGDNTKKEK